MSEQAEAQEPATCAQHNMRVIMPQSEPLVSGHIAPIGRLLPLLSPIGQAGMCTLLPLTEDTDLAWPG